MVRAILAGTKTQTRRIVKPQPQPNGGAGLHPVEPYRTPSGGWTWVLAATGHGSGGNEFRCPYGVPGDRLWVRERWSEVGTCDPGLIVYYADYPGCVPTGVESIPDARDVRWSPSIHMRRRDSRITLEITDVRVERLQDISQADAIAEGAPPSHPSIDVISREHGYEDFSRSWYAQLWDQINGAGSWYANPWVWVVSFRRLS